MPGGRPAMATGGMHGIAVVNSGMASPSAIEIWIEQRHF
jgi:hypothetical protein